jgi:hypothetical protein
MGRFLRGLLLRLVCSIFFSGLIFVGLLFFGYFAGFVG